MAKTIKRQDHSENYLVVKKNALIEAKYKMGLDEQKLVIFSVSKIKPEDKNFKEYTFQVKEFANLLDMGIRDARKKLRRLTKQILRRPLSIYPDSDTEIQCNWFASITYKQGQDTISFSFAPKLIPFLLNLKECFTAYRLKNILYLRSIYSIRLYELLKQYKSLGIREMKLADLRTVLGLEKGKYKLYGHFKQKVLEVARKELNASTDISFTYGEIKAGRRVTSLLFYIHGQKITPTDAPKHNPLNIQLEPGIKVQYHGKEYEVQEGNCLHLPDGIVPEGELRRNLLNTTSETHSWS